MVFGTKRDAATVLRCENYIRGKDREDEAGNPHMTYDILAIFPNRQYIHLPLFLEKLGDVDQWGAHASVVWLHIRR